MAKLSDADSTGNFVWAQRAGGTGDDQANALVISGIGVYVAGAFASPTAGFAPITLTNTVATGSADAFVAKLTDVGSSASFAWAQQAGGMGNDFARALAVSGTSVYVAGYFNSAMVGFGTTNLANAGFNDGFVAKLTDMGNMGNFVWAQRAGGTGFDQAYALAVSSTSV